MSDTHPETTPGNGWFTMHVKESNWVQSSRFGAGSGPCVILMVGHRPKPAGISFPVSELAAKDGASVEEVTDRPRKAYGQWPIFDKEAEPVWPLW